MRYTHTQRGHLQWLIWPVAAGCFVGAASAHGEDAPWVVVVLIATGAVSLLVSFCFLTLTIRDEGEALGVRYGPLALFRKRIAYGTIESAAPGRSRWVDGLGVHWAPGRGWTWNLWGFDCVELVVGGKPTRIGTDDREALVAFLKQRLAPAAHG